MRYKLLIVFLINTLISYSQEFVVEKVQLIETVDNKYVSEIPRLKDKLDDSNPVVDRINFQILDRFMINSYVQSELEEFRWYEVGCSSEIKENILYISFAGEYYGAYPNYVADELFFDLKSGESLKLSVIPFQALFTLSGYLNFLNKYWLEGVKKEFVTAIECAEIEPYCSYYDINNYDIDSNMFSISLTDDCYPHVAQGCSPIYSKSIELDSIKQYLNNIGKYILLESKYMTMTPIQKFLENEKLKEKVPNNVFLFGKIDDRYPFSMAINIDKKEQILGLYYYDSKLQKINLKGQSNDNTMFLTESVNNNQTGFFEFDINIDNYPIEGKWLNFEKSKSLNIKFTKIMSCKNN
ncbi:MAG: hypothetical protein HY951_04555 [Bacteroidia bacterium]|nr:hypothetical protein [Bacteroidia bacterium]